MKLSLSGRIAEQEHVKDRIAIDFAALAALAAHLGFQALCVRPSQATVATTIERLREMRAALDQHQLVASMVTADVRVAGQGTTPTRGASPATIEPMLRLAEELGAGMVRIALTDDEDIPLVQWAADAARERDLRLVHQTHTGTPFETLEGCRDMLARINRANFGLVIEPANLLLGGQDFGLAALQPLGAAIFNVYVQNLRVTASGPFQVATNRGPVRYERLVVGDPAGIDLARLIHALRDVGYQGFVTSHQPAADGVATADLAGRVHIALSALLNCSPP